MNVIEVTESLRAAIVEELIALRTKLPSVISRCRIAERDHVSTEAEELSEGIISVAHGNPEAVRNDRSSWLEGIPFQICLQKRVPSDKEADDCKKSMGMILEHFKSIAIKVDEAAAYSCEEYEFKPIYDTPSLRNRREFLSVLVLTLEGVR